MTDEELQRLLALDAEPGPAEAIDAAHADAIVDAALAGAGFVPGPGGGAGGAGSAGGATGAKLAIVGGALACIIVVALLARRGASTEPVAAVPPDAAIDAAVIASAEPPADAADAPPVVDETPPAVDEAPPVVDMTSIPPRRTAPARESATDLLAEANAKRAAKEWRASDALYARVVERAPNSLAAQTALVASAALHLEHFADPKGAAQRFRRALAIAPDGALAEDARWGLVETARARRDRAGEKAALDDFLANHASSPLAARAKARRAELQ